MRRDALIFIVVIMAIFQFPAMFIVFAATAQSVGVRVFNIVAYVMVNTLMITLLYRVVVLAAEDAESVAPAAKRERTRKGRRNYHRYLTWNIIIAKIMMWTSLIGIYIVAFKLPSVGVSLMAILVGFGAVSYLHVEAMKVHEERLELEEEE